MSPQVQATLCRDACGEACEHESLQRAIPVLEEVLLPIATDDNLVVALADSRGLLQYVAGADSARRRTDSIGFTFGTDWSTGEAGRNAPGLAVSAGKPVSVSREEHSREEVQKFSCSAVPLVGSDGAIVGALDVTGGDVAANPHVLSLLRSCAATVQREWRNHPAVAPPSQPQTRLRLLDRLRPTLDVGAISHPLTERHAELLTVLALHPGLTTEGLLDRCYPGHATSSTVRVELLRLRRWLASVPGAPTLESRPYRLSRPILVDAVEVTSHLARGEHQEALNLFHAPLAPHCDGVALDLVHSTAAALREAILTDADVDALIEYLARPQAADDADAWRLALQLLPPHSPRRALVVSHLEKLIS